MSNTSNYSITRINDSVKNYSFLNGEMSVTDKNVNFVFKPSIDYESLDFQAQVFSSNYSMHGELNLGKILRTSDSLVQDKLYQLYIYSYYKCYYNAVYNENFSPNVNMGFSFQGHFELFQILTNGRNQNIKGDVFVSYDVRMPNSIDKKTSCLSLIARFPFLFSSLDGISEFGFQPVIIHEYESYFSRLYDDYYSRSHVSRGSDGNPKTNPDIDLGYSNGRIEIIEMSSKATSSILSWNSIPIMNAFEDVKGNFLFILVGNGKDIEFNSSLAFSKANFLKLDISVDSENLSNRIYNKQKVSDKLSYILVGSEVFTITGIKCRSVIRRPSFKPKFSATKMRDFVSEFLSDSNKVPSIISSIVDKITAGISIDEAIEEIISEVKNTKPKSK